MKSNVVSLTIVVVAHNNAKTLEATIDRVYRSLSITVEDFGIIVFDDGSTDDTARVASETINRYPFVELRRNARALGAGYCLAQCSAATPSNYMAYVPADNTWPLRSFIELFGHVGKADIVTSYSNNLLYAMPRLRRFVSRGYTVLLNILFAKGIRYYNGLTIYPTDYLRWGIAVSHGFGFQAEALLKGVSAGYSFLEIALPVDPESLLRARSVTLANTLNAGVTALRLFWELQVLRAGRRYQAALRPAAVPTQRERHDAAVSRGGLTIVICGASAGIGASLARALAEDGHSLYICARRADQLAEVAKDSPSIERFVCDTSDEDQVERFAAAVSAITRSVDVVINCVGSFGEIGPVVVADTGRWWRTIEENLKSAYLVARYFQPLLARGRHARIINFSGGGAFGPVPNYSAYACAKAGVIRLTECLAEEFAPSDIRVNAIAPGFVPTEIHQATLDAGEERAGRLQFQRTRAILAQPNLAIENVVSCVRMMISPAVDELTGKTISSNFDPWQSDTFLECLAEIARSDLYSLRRFNIVNLPDGWLRAKMSRPWVVTPPEW